MYAEIVSRRGRERKEEAGSWKEWSSKKEEAGKGRRIRKRERKEGRREEGEESRREGKV